MTGQPVGAGGVARLLAGATATVLALTLTGCGGGEGLDEAKIERCATALVPYAEQAAQGEGLSFDEERACDDLDANEKSEAIARMYRKQAG